MKKIVAFLGSPRKNGYSTQLVHHVLEGAKATGAEVVIYDLNDEGVRGCQGCFYCRNHEGCATKDKLQPMYEDIKAAVGIVAGFPIYFGTISGQAKLWIDRMYPMLGDGHKPRYPGKRVVTIYAQANGDNSLFADAIKSGNRLFEMYGWDLAESLLVYGDVAPDFTLPKELLDRAYEAGKQLVLSDG